MGAKSKKIYGEQSAIYSPALLIFPNEVKRKNKPFKFANYLADKEYFLKTVEDVWKLDVTRFSMFVLTKKLKALNVHVLPIPDGDGLFTKKLSELDASLMVKDFTDKEIKDVMFGIDDNRSLGPDGYSAKFFKKGWSIMGKDICNSIMEFFSTGKILGEINATIISLVPMLPTPFKVLDFKPIACCNVVYKCISKILTGRIQGCLDKLINSNQSTIILRRQIQDNILLAQELMKGYEK
ncbi:hypothetical protein Tco_1198600 [Tanacetum coccineum]